MSESRDRLRFSLLDFKLGVRMLVRYPGLTLVGGLAMAFAIAIGAAAFEAVSQIIKPTLPFVDGDRIVGVRNWDIADNRGQYRAAHDFMVWREQLGTVRDLGAYRDVQRNLITDQGESGPTDVAEISASAFRITGIAPLLGRVLVEADEHDAAAPVIVIGYETWQRRFGGDATVIGRSARLGSTEVTIVGVMPDGFYFPMAHNVWAPLRRSTLQHAAGEGPGIQIFGRLAPGSTLAQAQAELSALGARTAAESPATHEHLRPQVMRYAEQNLPIQCGESWTRCMTMMRAGLYSTNILFVVFLLLVCANVALLMFARAATRESEIIVRTALGASRGRIVTQLVAEALVLGAVAAVIGLATARFALHVALMVLNQLGSIPFWWESRLSLPSVLYAVGLTVIGALVAGVMPALKVTRGTSVRLRQIAAGSGGLQFGGVWTTVIVAQIALTVIVVAMTVYTVQLTARVATFDLGFPAHQYLSVRLEMDDEIPVQVYDEFERRLRAESAVSAVTFAHAMPGTYHNHGVIEIEGIEATRGAQRTAVDANFFEVIGVPITAGRAFNATDASSDARVVVANEAFVTQALGGRNAIGRRVRFRVSEDEADPWGPWHDIVGVSGRVAMGGDPELSRAGLYMPLRRGAGSATQMAVHVRGSPESFAPQLRRVAVSIDPSLRLQQLRRIDQARADEARWHMMWVRILVGANALVLGLTLAGIYAIMSFTVSRRTREIGIRVALGADRTRLIASIFARPLAHVLLGVLIGVGLLVGLDGGIRSARVAGIVLAFTIFMLAICMLACVVPTRRALRIEPTEALKAEG